MQISDIIHSPLPPRGPWPQSYLDDIHLWLANAGQAGLWRNGFDNPDMVVNQRRAASGGVGAVYIGPDRWLVEAGAGNILSSSPFTLPGTLQDRDTPWQPVQQQGVAWTPAGAAEGVLSQKMEDVTRYAGQLVSLSFYANWIPGAGTPSLALTVDMVQNFGTAGGSSAPVTTPITSFTLPRDTSGALARYSVSFTVPSVVGKVVNGSGFLGLAGIRDDYLQIRFKLAANSAAGSVSFAGMQFTPGPYALPYVPPRVDETWARCQRFYAKTYYPAELLGAVNAPGELSARAGAANAIVAGLNWRFPVRMRAAPTMTAYSNVTGTAARIRNGSTGADMTVTGFTDTSDTCSGYLTLSAAPAATDLLLAHFAAEAELP